MNVKRYGLGVAILSLSLAATPALAQVCVGVPLNVSQTTLALRADFPDGVNIFGVRGANQLSDALTLAAKYEMWSPEFGDSRHNLGADVAFALPVNAGNFGVCATAGAQVSLSDDPRVIEVPVGVSIGGTFDVDSGIAIAPFANPALYWTRYSLDGGSSSGTDFGLTAGANLVVSNLYFGALVEKIFEDNSGTQFGVQAGIVF